MHPPDDARYDAAAEPVTLCAPPILGVRPTRRRTPRDSNRGLSRNCGSRGGIPPGPYRRASGAAEAHLYRLVILTLADTAILRAPSEENTKGDL